MNSFSKYTVVSSTIDCIYKHSSASEETTTYGVSCNNYPHYNHLYVLVVKCLPQEWKAEFHNTASQPLS